MDSTAVMAKASHASTIPDLHTPGETIMYCTDHFLNNVMKHINVAVTMLVACKWLLQKFRAMKRLWKWLTALFGIKAFSSLQSHQES